ncbi:MAG: LptE family protein [Planctomycetota bacterium]
MSRIAVLALTLLAAGCGYSTKPLRHEDVKSVALPIFKNDTVRRQHEFFLTDAVARMIQSRTRYRLADAERADVILEGEIADYETPGLVEGRDDQLVESQVSIRVVVTIRDRVSGAVRFQGTRTEVAPFSGRRGESEDTARFEVYERLARWVITTLEAGF